MRKINEFIFDVIYHSFINKIDFPLHSFFFLLPQVIDNNQIVIYNGRTHLRAIKTSNVLSNTQPIHFRIEISSSMILIVSLHAFISSVFLIVFFFLLSAFSSRWCNLNFPQWSRCSNGSWSKLFAGSIF